MHDEALALACRRRGLETAWGRSLDRLPQELLSDAERSLVQELADPAALD